MELDHPIVLLCVEGMRLEGIGRYEEAKATFTKAWETSADDFEACIAAHYLARHQASAEETLHWNQEALRRAEAVGDGRVQDFFPSLYLNLGHSYEQLGDMSEAHRYYQMARSSAAGLQEDRYGGILRDGIENGLQRTQAQGP